ncbi:MAG: hypothetical protein OXH19_07510 [Chloroflexi bacterium]|nr:hypothetical protein [Chloroflexota bacterium]MCY3587613.1 hypothetical protein [Chloroflexota bacterium]MCY3685757.1 hypothetical protein [Chloroflexota bacterium]MDE2708021.1 hypothetical protein [Chloroflexota bacterium]
MNGNESVEEGAGSGPVTGEGQLWALLQDLVEREGRDAAALRLGLSERTIRRTLADRHLSRKMTEALLYERDRQSAGQPTEPEHGPRNAPRETAHDIVEDLERRLDTLEREFKEWTEFTDADLGKAEEDIRNLERRLGFRRGSGGKLVNDSHTPPRTHPALVTVEPLPDDGDVFGEALPVLAEWRRALRALDGPPHTLAWLGATERLLRLEIQLIDDRRLTLPPDESPWDDVRRDTELQLRQHRLRELRRQRLWTEPLHWAARVVTLGRFGGEEELGRQMQREFEERRAELLSPSGERRIGRSRNVGTSSEE